jgi:hypothetical protein
VKFDGDGAAAAARGAGHKGDLAGQRMIIGWHAVHHKRTYIYECASRGSAVG